jgi:hypothetical protein
MNTAKKIKINYYTKAAYELASSTPCPRSANDVYSMGVSLQYCIRAKYLEIDGLRRSIMGQNFLVDQAKRQLAIKTEIEKQANYNLNVLLQKFYDQGGPIMEDPVSEEMVKNVRPFFNRIRSSFLQSLDETAHQTAIGKLSVEEMVTDVNRQITEMYNALGRMFPVAEVTGAFTDLIEIRQS